MTVTVEQARAFLERRTLARREDGERRAALLRSRLPAMAELLRSKYGVRSLRLFGSLARGEAHAHSDIDLAVEGLAPTRYFEALADVMRLGRGPVDLLRIEDAPASLRDRVAVEGEDL